MVIHLRYLIGFIPLSEITLLEFSFLFFFNVDILCSRPALGLFPRDFLHYHTGDLWLEHCRKATGTSQVSCHWFPVPCIFSFVSAITWGTIFFSSFLRIGAHDSRSFFLILNSFLDICNFYVSVILDIHRGVP